MGVLVTGCAGFIGMHVCQRLLARGEDVIGIDNLNDYYDPRLKLARLAQLRPAANFSFEKMDIADHAALENLFRNRRPRRVIHLAAQAGVRYSLINPQAYVQSNLVGFANILECCRHFGVAHLVYASSSSVYGANAKLPYSVSDNVDRPVSFYAATKKSNELMAHAYSHLYGLPTTGLRYFTVYGPWGRPDMSPWLFTSAILEGRTIDVFNHGNMQRDFTYIDDIADGTVRVLDLHGAAAGSATQGGSTSRPLCKVYNIGNHQPVPLMTFIGHLENLIGKTAVKNMLPMQPGDVQATYADIDALRQDVGFEPVTTIEEGLRQWVSWFQHYRTIGVDGASGVI